MLLSRGLPPGATSSVTRGLSTSSTAASASTTGAKRPSPFGALFTRSPDDVVVVAAKRTAITRAGKGLLSHTTPDELLLAAFNGVLRTLPASVTRDMLGDVVVGNVQQPGSYQMPARTAQLRAGVPHTVPLRSVNRQCGSGLDAIASVAASIAVGQMDAGLAGGVEHMTSGGNPNQPGALPVMNVEAVLRDPSKAKDNFTTMGITSENVAERYGVTRARQDAFASWSHDKALAAQKAGLFDEEIVPVTVTPPNQAPVVVAKDDGPRAGSTPEVLAKLKPVFKENGSSTAGNSSPTNDGAAAVVLMRRREAERLGVPVMGVFRGYKVVGVEPAFMGVGPAYAIPPLLQEAGITVKDVDAFEINEAFASQALFCADALGLPTDPAHPDAKKLNPRGGAIALGHPLGATGARQVTTLLHHLAQERKRVGVVSMCMGTGMGAAALFEVEAPRARM